MTKGSCGDGAGLVWARVRGLARRAADAWPVRVCVAVAVVVVAAYAVWWFVFSSGLLAPAGFVYAQY